MLQQFGERIDFWLADLTTSVLFVSGHVQISAD
jgi:hypothetical protein